MVYIMMPDSVTRQNQFFTIQFIDKVREGGNRIEN